MIESNLFVQLGKFQSEIFNVTSGVPQGSHLEPLLFILFVNDLPSVPNHSEWLLFADDLKLFWKITSLTDCQLLQLDIDAISNWSIINDLPLNIKKSCSLTFSTLKHKINFSYQINSNILEKVESIKDLGVNNKENFKEHIV